MPSDISILEQILQELRSMNRDNEQGRREIERREREILEQLKRSNRTLNQILASESDFNDTLVLSIPSNIKGETMGNPVNETVAGGPVQAQVQELKAGVPGTLSGAIAFSSDNPAVASVDPASGMVTPVSVGTANISATDSTNVPTLTDSVAVTVVAGGGGAGTNDQLILTIPSNTTSSRRF